MKLQHLSGIPLFDLLISIDLPRENFAVFGSAPLFLHGLRDTISDLDIVVQGTAWDQALRLGPPVPTDSGEGMKVVLENGKIEIYEKWAPGTWDVAALIRSAEIVEGIRFVTLPNVLTWKRIMGRPKDVADVEKIASYLARTS